MNTNSRKIRVLVVDDSALMRKLIPQILEADPSIEVVGTAMDGNFCLKKIEELQPNVVTLDLQMPGMNGIDTLKEIMRLHPMPVIVVSSHSTEGASVTLKALGLGAFDFVTKPQDASAHMAEMETELIAKIHAAADCKVVRPESYGECRFLHRKSLPERPRLRPANWWRLEFLPEVHRPLNFCWPNCLRTFRERSLSCNTCPKASPICLRAAWMNCARCA